VEATPATEATATEEAATEAPAALPTTGAGDAGWPVLVALLVLAALATPALLRRRTTADN
jgi:MYXO-CTERM domain-containing protein